MHRVSLQQQMLDTTSPGRDNRREDFARNAPDHVLQCFVDRLRSDCELVEKDTLNWIVKNYPLRFTQHDTLPLVKARDYDLLNAVTYSSDLIPSLWSLKTDSDGIAQFIATAVDDMRDLWQLPITRENVRARVIYLVICRQRPATKEDYSLDLFGYIRDNLNEVEVLLERIFEMNLVSVPEISELLVTHGTVRVGVL